MARWWLALVVVGVALLLAGCPTSRPVVSVSIDQGSSVAVEVGESLTLSATVVVGGVASEEVVWSASCGAVSGSGAVVVFSAPTVESDCVVTATSVVDVSAGADVVVLVRAVPEVMFDGGEPVSVEVNELGRVVVERSAGDRRFEVSLEVPPGLGPAGAVLTYEEFGSVALFRAVHPVGRGVAVHLHDLAAGAPGPSEVMEASALGTTFGIALVLALTGAVWNQSRVLYAEVDVTLERVPATSAEDGVTEVCVSPEDFVYLLLTSAAAQEKEIEALQVLGLGVLMTAATAGIHVPAVDVAGAVSDLGHLSNALAEPLVEDLQTFARSALEVPGFGSDEYLEVTFLGFRHLPGVAGGATWSTAVITGAGCDPGAFVSETGTVEFTSSLEDVTPWGDAPVTVRIDPPAAYVDVYLYQSGRHGTSGEDYLRRFPPAQTNALGFAEFWLPFNGDGIRSLRAVVPERRASATAEVSWALEAARDMSPQLFNLQFVGHQGVVGERVTLRYRVGEADRLIGCEVDWREGAGWEAFDCPPRGVAGHSTEAVRSIEHVYSKTGLFRPTLRVRNAEGLVSQAYAVVSVTEPPVNSAPVVDSVTFDGANLSWQFRDDDILDQHHCYFWQVTPDRRFVWGDWACSRSGSALVSVPDPLAEFRLDVTDGFVMDRWTLRADVNSPPEVSGFAASPSSVTAGDTVTFSWSAIDPDGDALTCTLDVDGSGTADYVRTAADCEGTNQIDHTYESSGVFAVTLTIEDDLGGTASASTLVRVASADSLSDPVLLWSTEPFNWALTEVEWSPDGEYFATGHLPLLVWNAQGERVLELPDFTNRNALAWSPEGSRIATIGTNGLNVWDVHSQEQLVHIAGQRDSALDWSPDGTLLATASWDGVYLWNAVTGEPVAVVGDPEDADPDDIAWSPDGSRLAVGYRDGLVLVRRADNWDLVMQHQSDGFVVSLVWGAGGDELLIGNSSSARVVDPSTGAQLRSFSVADTRSFYSFDWSDDGSRVVGSCGSLPSGSHVVVWDAATATVLDSFAFDQERGVGLDTAWRPGSQQFIVVGGLQGRVKAGIWDAGSRSRTFAFENRIGEVVDIAECAGMFATVSNNSKVQLWNTRSNSLVREVDLRTLVGDPYVDLNPREVACSTDGRLVAAGLTSSSPPYHLVYVFNRDSLALVREFPVQAAVGVPDRHAGLSWNPDGNRIAIGAADEVVYLANVETGRVEAITSVPGLATLAYSPDGAVIAAASEYGPVQLLDAASGRVLRPLSDSEGQHLVLSWAPDGRRLTGAGPFESVKTWDADTGELLWQVVPGDFDLIAGRPASVAWSEDATLLAIGVFPPFVGPTSQVDVVSGNGQLLGRLMGYISPPWGLAWSGENLATGATRLAVWEVSLAEE